METSTNFGFFLPSSVSDDIADINKVSDNFRLLDETLPEFAKGDDLLYVTVTNNQASHTPIEIKAFVDAGGLAVLEDGYFLMSVDDRAAYFSKSKVDYDNSVTLSEYTIFEDGRCAVFTKTHVIPDATKVEQLLYRNALSPSYVYQYIRDISNDANKHTDAKALTFLWVTDTHTRENDTRIGSIVAQMTKYVPCEFVAHTGDIIDGLTAPSSELSTLSEMNRNMQDAACPVFYVKGNHDDNCLYARSQVVSGLGRCDDYILTSELYARTNAFNQSARGNGDMYCYYDDEVTKIRSIFFNSYDYTEECDKNGIRVEDAHAGKVFSQEQLNWLETQALNFTDKETPTDWGVILFSHEYLHANVYKILGDYQKGLNTFAGRGNGEVVAWFVGDDHLDMLSKFNWVYDAGFSTARLTCLNASMGFDGYNSATTDNKVLYPPRKVADTENETAFDLVTVDRANHLIYLTRYGARSYAYNTKTGAYDTIVARTRVVDYTTGTYKVLTGLEPADEKVEATNVLIGMTFENGAINSTTGEDLDSTTNMRSNMVDVSTLQATTDTALTYHFVLYSTDENPVLSAVLMRYNASNEFVNGVDLNNTSLIEQYGYPAGSVCGAFSYNRHTPIKKVRYSVDARNSARVRVAIYKLVGDVPELVDQCDVDNPQFQKA